MEKTNVLGIPVVTLSNGLRVANFSSPHPFTFVDGTVLPACPPERAQDMKLEAVEEETVEVIPMLPRGISYTNISLEWKMSKAVADELTRLLSRKDIESQFDILLVPLPVMTALKAEGNYGVGKARCVRMADRVTKAAHIDRFCI